MTHVCDRNVREDTERKLRNAGTLRLSRSWEACAQKEGENQRKRSLFPIPQFPLSLSLSLLSHVRNINKGSWEACACQRTKLRGHDNAPGPVSGFWLVC